ncbi:MAG TPA: acetolactate synthase small subunit [Flammeovirgaceae bacterium]|nr:acetolactate synthase small subunit [Flammeovirgaceae bacterium]
MEERKEEVFTISVLTENKSGLLNAVTIIFTRRKMNIEAINVSETEVEGVSRFTIVIKTTYALAEQVVKQINKLVEVLGAFLYREDEIYYQEIALFKMPADAFQNSTIVESLVRNNGARILVIEKDHIVIEKTGHRQEIRDLRDKLEPFGLLEYVRSGRIAISKSKRKTHVFLKELEKANYFKKENSYQ